MQNVLIYAKTAASRKLYHRTLSKREIETFRAKDAAEVFLFLASFEIDTVILVDEGAIHELNMVLEVLIKKYDHKRVILISPTRRAPRGMECYGSSRDFLSLFS